MDFQHINKLKDMDTGEKQYHDLIGMVVYNNNWTRLPKSRWVEAGCAEKIGSEKN